MAMAIKKDHVMQGGVRNYASSDGGVVGKIPRRWQSSPDQPETMLAYITDAEAEVLRDVNVHGKDDPSKIGIASLGPAGIPSFDDSGWGYSEDPNDSQGNEFPSSIELVDGWGKSDKIMQDLNLASFQRESDGDRIGTADSDSLFDVHSYGTHSSDFGIPDDGSYREAGVIDFVGALPTTLAWPLGPLLAPFSLARSQARIGPAARFPHGTDPSAMDYGRPTDYGVDVFQDPLDPEGAEQVVKRKPVASPIDSTTVEEVARSPSAYETYFKGHDPGYDPYQAGFIGEPSLFGRREVVAQSGGGIMNLRNQANQLASQGRGGDTMLMHMRPDEVAGLASLGGVTRNPETGLPEGFLLPALGAALPGLMGWGAASIPLAALYTGLGAGAGQAVQSKILGEDDPLKKGLVAGLTAGIGSAALSGFGKAFGAGDLTKGAAAEIGASGADKAAYETFRGVLPQAGSPQTEAMQKMFEGSGSGLGMNVGPKIQGWGDATRYAMAENPGLTGGSLGGFGGMASEAAAMPQYGGPMPGEGTSGKSFRDPQMAQPKTPRGRTGLAQSGDLTSYGFRPEGLFFGEGVYAQGGGALPIEVRSRTGKRDPEEEARIRRATALANVATKNEAFTLGRLSNLLGKTTGDEEQERSIRHGENIYEALRDEDKLGRHGYVEDLRTRFQDGGLPQMQSTMRRPAWNPFGGHGQGVQGSVQEATGNLGEANQALQAATDQVNRAMGTLNPRSQRQSTIGGKGGGDPRFQQQMPLYAAPSDAAFPTAQLLNTNRPPELTSILPRRMQEGGVGGLPEGGGDEVALQVTQDDVDAVRGEHPEPEIAIEAFVSYFGPEAFDSLRRLVIQEESLRSMGEADGLVNGDDGGRDDIQRGTIDGDQELNISGGEYIFSADDVALLGDGNTDAGARRLDQARAKLRRKATGTTERPAYMGEGAVEEIFEEAMTG